MRYIDRLLDIFSNDKYFRLSLFIIIFIITSSYFLFRFSILHRGYEELFPGFDFSVYYNAAKAFLNNVDVYPHYLYPPLSIIFIIPFAYLHFDQAFLLMCLLNLLALFAISFLILKILYHYNISLSFWEKSLLPFAIFAFFPVTNSFYGGQINIIILLLVTLFYYFFIKNRNLYANLSLSLATIIKVWPLILIIFYLLKGKKKFAATFLSMLSISFIISILLFGIHSHIRFIETLMKFQRGSTTYPYLSLSLSSMFLRFFEFFNIPYQDAFSIIFTIFKIILIIMILYYLHVISFDGKYYTSNDWEILVFSLMITLTLVFSNMTWYYYGTFLVLPYILCIYVLNLNGVEKILISASIILFSLYPLFTPSGVNLVLTMFGLGNFKLYYTYVYTLSPLVYGPLLFLGFILYKLSRSRKEKDYILSC